MTKRTNDPSACAALRIALADGRFGEDPWHWREHVSACEECMASVAGFLDLRERIARAREEQAERAGTPPPRDPQAVVAHAMARYRLARTRRHAALGVGAALLVGLGLTAILRGGSVPAEPASPLALAMELHRTVHPADGGPARLTLLHTDAAQRARFERALDHPVAAVRRIALSALTSSGIPVDSTRLEEVLRTWNEDLETPLEVAAAPGTDTGRFLAEALETARTQTLQEALKAASYAADRGERLVPAGFILPHVQHADPKVQEWALVALAKDTTFVPGREIEAVFEDGRRRVEVRHTAALFLIERLGDDGVRRVVRYLGRSGASLDLEAPLTGALVGHADGRELARRRMAAEEAPIRLALAYAASLLSRSEPVPQADLVRRALAARDPWTAEALAECARVGDWAQDRDGLQGYWLEHLEGFHGQDPRQARACCMPLLLWDEASGQPARLNQALDICAALRQPRGQQIGGWLERIAGRAEPGVAERARALLAEQGRR